MFLESDAQILESKCQLVKNGFATFFSFILFGCIPLIMFILLCSMNSELYNIVFYISIGITAFTMFLLGFFQSIISH